MPTFLQSFFKALTEPRSAGGTPLESSLQLATAALLVEMMRADNHISAAEEEATRAALRQEFNLDDNAVELLIAQAETEAREAPGYFAFTSRLNREFSSEQKLRVMEYLWRIALADGHLAAHENHLMRKLGDLIHIGHGDYIAAKERARHYLETKDRAA